ncbi:hypothetical protein FF1_028319 [Malus domestica]
MQWSWVGRKSIFSVFFFLGKQTNILYVVIDSSERIKKKEEDYKEHREAAITSLKGEAVQFFTSQPEPVARRQAPHPAHPPAHSPASTPTPALDLAPGPSPLPPIRLGVAALAAVALCLQKKVLKLLNEVSCFALTPDGQLLATASEDAGFSLCQNPAQLRPDSDHGPGTPASTIETRPDFQNAMDESQVWTWR